MISLSAVCWTQKNPVATQGLYIDLPHLLTCLQEGQMVGQTSVIGTRVQGLLGKSQSCIIELPNAYCICDYEIEGTYLPILSGQAGTNDMQRRRGRLKKGC